MSNLTKIIENIVKIYDIKQTYYENIINEKKLIVLIDIINTIVLLYKFIQTWDALTPKKIEVGMIYKLG